MTLLDKLDSFGQRLRAVGDGPVPFNTVIDEVLNATDVVIAGRRVLMCGSNNYLGLTFHPDVTEAGRAATARDGAGTTGSRAANGTYAAHRRLEREFAELYGKTHAIVFTTGYQANLALISGLCAAD